MMTASPENSPKLPPPPPAWVNKILKWLLRSPLHGLISKNIMLITVTGRKSGKKYMLPVSYARVGNTVLCSTERDVRNWWKNARGGADVTLWLRGQEVAGHAEAIYDDPEAVAQGIETMLTQVPRDARYYDVRLDGEKRPFPQDIARAAQRRVIIKVQI